jgi:glycosyltransferase involved in cell wall biosynthesis
MKYEKSIMRVLWLNWRDIKNPEAGGSEVLTHEIASKLVKNYNYQITLFTSEFPGGAAIERIDGIDVIRQGSSNYGVYKKAKNHIKTNLNNYDFIIDEINARGFLTPKFVTEKPLLAIIHQLSTEQFIHEIWFPLNYFARYYLEKKWLSYYKTKPIVTVSNSTRSELEKMGFTKILLIPEGLSASPKSAVPIKETEPTVVFIGRLKKHKLPHHAIHAFSLIREVIPNARLWVIGDGYMREKLEKLNAANVTFYGHVNNSRKFELLSKAHLVLMPAMREGWGLVVTESNAMGTPVVAYNVPGLRDSVKDNETGILAKENTPRSLATSAIFLLKNPDILNKFSSKALDYSRQFSWDISTQILKDIIENISKEYNSRK